MANQPEVVEGELQRRLPGQRVVLLGRDSVTGDPVELRFVNGKLDVNAAVDVGDISIDPTGLATDTGQATEHNDLAAILTQLTDGPLPVSGDLTVDTTGLATSARQDTLAALVSTETTLAAILAALTASGLGALSVEIKNALDSAIDSVTVVPGTGAAGLGKAEDAAHSSGDVGVMALTVRKDAAAATAGTDGDYQPPITDANGRMWVNNSGVTQPVSLAAAAAAIAKAEDVASADADVGVPAMMVRKATPANTSGTDGDYEMLQGSAGRLWTSATLDNTATKDHDDANATGNKPVMSGLEAKAFGSDPTAVSAGDVTKRYSTVDGVPFSLGGHPNIVTIEAAYTSAQTDTAVVTQGSGGKIVVTQAMVVCDSANTVAVGFRLGLGPTNTPTTTGVVATHPGLVPGSGVSRGDGSGILGIGADGDDLRFTCTVPTGGSVRVLVSYFISDV